MKSFLQKLNPGVVKKWVLRHKIRGAIIILAIFGLGFLGYKHFFAKSGETKYVLAEAKIGKITSSVSGTGYVSAQNQIDIKSKVSGDITYVGVKSGDFVKQGTTIAKVDARDAEIALENQQISYQ